MHNVSAAQITNRSLTLQAGTTDSNADGIPDGGSMPSGIVDHLFTFTLPAETLLGSIKFQYCTTAAAVPGGVDCNLPAGVNTTSAGLGSSNGATFSSIVTTTPGAVNGAPYVTRPAAQFNGGAVSIQLTNVQNPSATNTTFFVRISTYASTDATGSAIDTGTVAASTANPIVLSGTMPESLVFCTGATIPLNSGGVPDCPNATSGAIAFNQLFSPTDTASATSQMAASTNAGQGYVITVNGPTLTSGSNTITPMMSGVGNTGNSSIHGLSEFGMNLKANTTAVTTTATGLEVSPASDTTQYKGEATTGGTYGSYGTVDSFTYHSGDAVADSADGGAGGSNAQIFTSSYIVNVPGNQPAGTYTTTLTYICTASF